MYCNLSHLVSDYVCSYQLSIILQGAHDTISHHRDEIMSHLGVHIVKIGPLLHSRGISE